MRRHLRAASAALALFAIASLAASNAPQASSPKPPAAPPPTKTETDRTGLLMHCPKPNVAGFIGDPYPLDTCPVSGEKLGADAVTVVLKDQRDALQEGRQLKFCCKDCAAKYEANPHEYQTKLDEAIVAKQRPSYPLDRCLVMLDEKLTDDTKTFVYGNRCYVACCKKCVNNFQKNTARYVTAYEKAVTGRQRNSYPLDTCVVSGEKLGEKRFEFIVVNQLVRTCCEDCAKKVLENPAPYLAKIAEAKTKAKGEGQPKASAEH